MPSKLLALKPLRDPYERLNSRERTLVLLAAALVTAFLLYQALAGTFMRRAELVRQQQDSRKTLATLERTLATAKQMPADRADAGVRAALAQAEQQLAQQRDGLQRLAVTLIPPRQMAAVLQTLLRQTGGLRLLELRNEPAEPLLPATKGESGNLYRHTIVLRFEGDYPQTLAYLHRLQQLERRLSWDRLDYSVVHYPRAQVELELHTLSLSPGLVGV